METLKKKIICGLAEIANTDAVKQNEIIITTALGLISGKIYTGEDAKAEPAGEWSIGKFVPQTVGNYNPANIDGNDGFLVLKDVAIRTGANITFKVPNLIVFYDQIIGVTIGSIG